ncbi:MAG: winged helix-turn-helix domain-containing protein [Candidatus Micrarchaeaceae archaeon]
MRKGKSLFSILEIKDNWSIREVSVLIKEKFGVKYLMKHVRELLRQMGMKFGKLYPQDYRRSKDADENLKTCSG